MIRSGRLLFSAVALGTAVLLAGPAPVSAQDAATTGTESAGRGDRPRGGGGGGGAIRAALAVSNLSDEQKAKLEKLQTDFREKIDAARKAAGTGEGQRGGWNNPEMQKLMTDMRTQVEAILTDEQKKEYEEKLKAGRGAGRERRTTGTEEKKP
jgi:Spy/CpxP family protein refolding chaperone